MEIVDASNPNFYDAGAFGADPASRTVTLTSDYERLSGGGDRLHAATAATAQQVAKKIEAGFGVRVLKVRRSQVDGRAVYLVTVMNPGGPPRSTPAGWWL